MSCLVLITELRLRVSLLLIWPILARMPCNARHNSPCVHGPCKLTGMLSLNLLMVCID